jgi:hypothetical protein
VVGGGVLGMGDPTMTSEDEAAVVTEAFEGTQEGIDAELRGGTR